MSKNLYLDSTDDKHPYLIIKSDDGNNLFYSAADNYYLKTNNYKPNTEIPEDEGSALIGGIVPLYAGGHGLIREFGSGTKIDLNEGLIDCSNFILRGGKFTDNLYRNRGTVYRNLIRVSSISPFLQIANMVYIGEDAYYF
jgi:hypothetical protein